MTLFHRLTRVVAMTRDLAEHALDETIKVLEEKASRAPAAPEPGPVAPEVQPDRPAPQPAPAPVATPNLGAVGAAMAAQSDNPFAIPPAAYAGHEPEKVEDLIRQAEERRERVEGALQARNAELRQRAALAMSYNGTPGHLGRVEEVRRKIDKLLEQPELDLEGTRVALVQAELILRAIHASTMQEASVTPEGRVALLLTNSADPVAAFSIHGLRVPPGYRGRVRIEWSSKLNPRGAFELPAQNDDALGFRFLPAALRADSETQITVLPALARLFGVPHIQETP